MKKDELHIQTGLKRIFTLKGVLSVGLMSFALQTFLTTFDLIPDSLGIIGAVDDILLILLGIWAAMDLFGFLEKSMGQKKKK